MKFKLLFLLTLFSMIGLSGSASDPRKYTWYGEQPFAGDGYTPEFYIYNVGTKKFLTTTGLVAPGKGIEPTLFRFTLREEDGSWYIQNPDNNYLRVWYDLNGSYASTNSSSSLVDAIARYTLGTTLEQNTCHDTQANGTVYMFRSNQLLSRAYLFFNVNADETFSSLTVMPWNVNDKNATDNTKFLLVSPTQYQKEIDRKADVDELDFSQNNVNVTSYLINPTILQTQGTATYAPYGWAVGSFAAGDNNITDPNLGINADTRLQCWTPSSMDFRFDYNQKVTLPAGSYEFTAEIFMHGDCSNAVLYVMGSGLDVMSPIPPSVEPNTANYKVEFSLNVETEVQLGVKTTSESGFFQSWVAADNFKLKFLSNTNATAAKTYWYGESATAELEYYLCNFKNGLFINENPTKPGNLYEDENAEKLVVLAKKYKFNFSNDQSKAKISRQVQSNSYLYLRMEYELLNTDQYRSMLSSNGEDAYTNYPFVGRTLTGTSSLNISGPNNDKRGSYQFSSGNSVHYFGLSDSQTYDSNTSASDDVNWWMAISQHQLDCYEEYVRTYVEALGVLGNEEYPMLKMYEDELRKWLNTPAQYNPSKANDNVTPELRRLLDLIYALEKLEDKGTTLTGRYGTRCLYYDFKVEGATLYTVEGLKGPMLVLNEVTNKKGEAGEAYIYQATADEQTFRNQHKNYKDEPSISNPFMRGVYDDKLFTKLSREVPVGCYVLQTKKNDKGEDVQKFYKVTKEGSKSTAYRCYVTVPKQIEEDEEARVNGYRLFFEDDTTDVIQDVFGLDTGKAPVIYDLNGRRLPSLQKGINIVNGHKVLVK